MQAATYSEQKAVPDFCGQRLNWTPEERDEYISNIKVVDLPRLEEPYPINNFFTAGTPKTKRKWWDACWKERPLADPRYNKGQRRAIINLDKSRLRYVIKQGESVIFRNADTKELVLERERLLNLKARGMAGLLWNMTRSRLPPEIIAEYNDLIEEYDLPRMDMMRDGDTFSFKIDRKKVTFRDLELPPPSGLSAINYARYTHKETNGNNWIVACTCKALRTPDKGGIFYLASYGIMMEGPEKRTGYEVPPDGEINTGMVFEVSKAIKNARYNSDWLNERARPKLSKLPGQTAARVNKQTSHKPTNLKTAPKTFPLQVQQGPGQREIWILQYSPRQAFTYSHHAVVKSWSVAKAAGSQTDVDAVYKKAIHESGHADVLVNSHGAMNVGSSGAADPSKWWENFGINICGVCNMYRGLVGATGGSGIIIDATSLAASFVVSGMSGCGAAKQAVIKFGEYLTVEQPALRVSSIHPGMVKAENGHSMVVELPSIFQEQGCPSGLLDSCV
ncbi:hypothetical protein DL762_002814 [Monosporascus cannonballus]|uniref:Uncharacterized protein n=1 Tax=Monosporascus cannonballus TaxID=155416 RepID=A0ABY0HCE1_9PEZI|nr:hypothetical protein DL762_002814 [Monosporascus cannonballus]